MSGYREHCFGAAWLGAFIAIVMGYSFLDGDKLIKFWSIEESYFQILEDRHNPSSEFLSANVDQKPYRCINGVVYFAHDDGSVSPALSVDGSAYLCGSSDL